MENSSSKDNLEYQDLVYFGYDRDQKEDVTKYIRIAKSEYTQNFKTEANEKE